MEKNNIKYYDINYPDTYFVDEKNSEPGKKVVLINRSSFMESLISEYFNESKENNKNINKDVKKILEVIKSFEKLYKLIYVYNQGNTINYNSLKDLERTYYVIVKEIELIENHHNGDEYRYITYKVIPCKLEGSHFNFPSFMVFFDEETAETFLKDNIKDIRLIGDYLVPINIEK